MNVNDLMDALGSLPEEYLARALDEEPPQKHTAFLVSKPFLAGVSTAACLLLIVGLGVGVWSRQQKIETRPPQETPTTTVSETETRTETTAQVTTGSQMTVKQTAATTKMLETTATLPEVITSYTTAVQTSVMTTAETTPEHTAPATKVQTSAATTAALTSPVVTVVPISTTYEGHYRTIPPRVTEHSADIVTTQTQQTILTEPIQSTTQEMKTTEPANSLPGFKISDPDNEQRIQVTYIDQLTPSPAKYLKYILNLNEFHEEDTDSPTGVGEYYYKYVSDDGTQVFYLTQREREVFQFRCNAEDKLFPAEVNGHSSLFVQKENVSILYWDDGAYTFELNSKSDDIGTFIRVAESLEQMQTKTE